MRSAFRDLTAYAASAALARDLHRVVASWPSFERWTIGLQLVRAADSIGANIAEAAGRWHYAEKRRFLLIARGSLFETEHWLTRAAEQSLIAPDMTTRLDEIAWTLGGLLKKPTRS